MKEIKKEKPVEHYTIYQAEDGTEFSSIDECKKYENSATSVLISKLLPAVICDEVDSEWFDGSDENQYKTIVPKNESHIDILNHLYFMYEGRNEEKPMFSKGDILRPIIMGYRVCGPDFDWLWFFKADTLIKNITNEKFKLVENKE